MLFNSIEFLIFFPVVTTLYFLLPHRFRWFLLFVSSCIFYAAAIPAYLLILFALIVIDYFAAILVEQHTGKKRKMFLVVSILSMCLALFIFKYFNFFNANITALARLLDWNYSVDALKLLLPIGLSFHTFQSLSYVIEVYRGHQKAERNFGIYALYVMFYPQLVAGPIERPKNLLHQFYEEHYFDYQRVVDGLKLMLWGLFKKVVIADRLSVLVNEVYGNPSGHQGFLLVIATVFFAFQIFCDFSGYSDMAIGSAQVMGFKLMDNFNRPYFSKSIAEFWKRWHISLSSWFRDYIYIPLGGNRVPQWRMCCNLFLTFLLSGLWHGANWTFVIWGGLNGFYMVFSILTHNPRKKLVQWTGLDRHPKAHKYLNVMVVFSLVCLGWIFFRARNVEDALYIVHTIGRWMFDVVMCLIHGQIKSLASLFSLKWSGMTSSELGIAFASIIFLLFVHSIQRHGSIRHMLRGAPVYLRWAFYELLFLAVLFLGVFNKMQFIYFQF